MKVEKSDVRNWRVFANPVTYTYVATVYLTLIILLVKSQASEWGLHHDNVSISLVILYMHWNLL